MWCHKYSGWCKQYVNSVVTYCVQCHVQCSMQNLRPPSPPPNFSVTVFIVQYIEKIRKKSSCGKNPWKFYSFSLFANKTTIVKFKGFLAKTNTVLQIIPSNPSLTVFWSVLLLLYEPIKPRSLGTERQIESTWLFLYYSVLSHTYHYPYI